MLTTTIDQLPGRIISQYLGVVSGTSVIGGDDREALVAALDATVDGIPTPFERLEREARLRAMDQMRGQAELAGANAVVGLHITHVQIDPTRLITAVFAYGTAVKLESW
jgi:uncharacterized protein YbjQ (UPF0145 family)